MTTGAQAAAAELLEFADREEQAGRALHAIETLTQENRRSPDPAVEHRLVRLRHAAFRQLQREPSDPSAPPSVPSVPSMIGAHGIAEVDAQALSVDALRSGIATTGCLLVRELASAKQVDALVDGIDRALETWGSLRRPYAGPTGSPWFDPLPVDEPEKTSLGRTWVTNGGGLLTADSPRMLFLLLETFEAIGLRKIATDFLGERAALSANKCTLRRVSVDTNANWHQDGAFLGRDIRALNIWLALSHCGDDAPGLDIVPRRFESVVETGTRGAYFDWAVGRGVVDEVAQDTPIVRPIFEAGDALLFDELLLHQTAADRDMTRARHAIETWCFAPSAYPAGHVPIVW